MKALIMKDILTLGSQAKILLTIIIGYSIFGAVLNNTFFVSALPIMILSMLAITSFSYDKLAGWDLFALSMPITKKQIVSAKYSLSLLLIFAGGLFGLILSLLTNAIYHTSTLAEISGALCGYMLAGLALNALTLPLAYKIGVEKARMGLVMVFLVPVIIVLLLGRLGFTVPTIAPEMGKALIIGVFLATIALFVLSYYLSVRIYTNQER